MDELVKRLRRCEQFRCRECEYEQVMGCRAKLNAEAADAIEELQADKAELNGTVTNLLEQIKDLSKPRWIPVAERMPERFKSVLTIDKYGVITFNWIRGDGENWSNGYYITHWIPLPQPPKEE